MAFNLPTVTNNNISFGPGVVKIGTVANTPTSQLGAISEDGVTLELINEKKYITQGNPKLNQLVFSQTQGATLTVSSIEWNTDNFKRAMGTGLTETTVDTAYGSAGERFGFGGDPRPYEVALLVEHAMGVASHTIYLEIWRACGEGGISIPLGHDEHTFEYKWVAMSTSTDWAGNNLDTANTNLFRVSKATAS